MMTANAYVPDRIRRLAWILWVTVPWFTTVARVPAEAFPEMRAQWDRRPANGGSNRRERLFQLAEGNARQAAEAFYRCHRYLHGWLAQADPVSGLIPRNLTTSRDFWNGRDAGADNYAFMVLTAAFTDRDRLEGRLREMLRTEQRLTARVDRLCDDYSFPTKTYRRTKLDLDATIFDSAEYVKDGLIPLTEWLGPSPWSDRMIGLVEDIWKNATIEIPGGGRIPTLNFEVNGDLLQACSRLFWFTRERKYMDWAIQLGDYYLLGTNHPTRHMQELRLRDHGGEMVNGLTELYVLVKHMAPGKARLYRAPLQAIFDRILEAGRNPHGLLFDGFNPQTGQHSQGICDTWGYIYDGFYTVHLLERNPAYRDAIRQALGNLQRYYSHYPWEGSSADGYADSLESALNLLQREPVDSAAKWIDSEIRLMWAKQQTNGVIEGWHGDGNFARTSLMYALWKTQGLQVQPWRPDVRVGAVATDRGLAISLVADAPWEGRLVFDRPRHREYLHLPLDYPRINQFPEWFTVSAEGRCLLREVPKGATRKIASRELREGVPLKLAAHQERRFLVRLAD